MCWMLLFGKWHFLVAKRNCLNIDCVKSIILTEVFVNFPVESAPWPDVTNLVSKDFIKTSLYCFARDGSLLFVLFCFNIEIVSAVNTEKVGRRKDKNWSPKCNLTLLFCNSLYKLRAQAVIASPHKTMTDFHHCATGRVKTSSSVAQKVNSLWAPDGSRISLQRTSHCVSHVFPQQSAVALRTPSIHHHSAFLQTTGFCFWRSKSRFPCRDAVWESARGPSFLSAKVLRHPARMKN